MTKFFRPTQLTACLLALILTTVACAQPPKQWQQAIAYNMDVNLDTRTHLLRGTQTIRYTNNSPDALNELYFHLYWNAFQPNSSMDVRSQELGTKVIGRNPNGTDRLDWDARVKDRISKLQPHEIGYNRITSITLNGKALKGEDFETIVKYRLPQSIKAGETVTIQTSFEAQVPVQIRRSGRNNAEGIDYSMAQWYPKLAAYDQDGWHPNPYIAREFYGVWGDYDVKITLDKNQKIGASGVLQNAAAIGWGYDKPGTELRPIASATRTWHFKAEKIHDFVWAADTEYIHFTRQPKNGPLLHFVHKDVDSTNQRWQRTADSCSMAYAYMRTEFGPYPWTDYSFLQGGDGGMEYGMATLVKSSSLGTALHEWMHSWYQHLFATNESLYGWMDEGFTTWAEEKTIHWLRGNDTSFAMDGPYRSYLRLATSRFEEPLSTHADHYGTNYASATAVYQKGAVFLTQLGYIMGDSLLRKTMLNYYDAWKFRHPTPDDFMRLAETTSGLHLDWYKEYWINSTYTIDYAVDSLWQEGNSTNIRIKRKGEMPMPVDVTLYFKDGSREQHYIPLSLMYGTKPAEGKWPRTTYPAQPWTHRLATISTSKRLNEIVRVVVDDSQRLADIDRQNNVLELRW